MLGGNDSVYGHLHVLTSSMFDYNDRSGIKY